MIATASTGQASIKCLLEVISADDMAPTDELSELYTLVDSDADGFPDYLINLATGARIGVEIPGNINVTHPYAPEEPFLLFDVPAVEGYFLAIIADQAPADLNITRVSRDDGKVLSHGNYFRKGGKFYVVDRAGGQRYTVLFRSGLVISDLYYRVWAYGKLQPRAYPYLPNPGDSIEIFALVKNEGSVSESGILTVTLGGIEIASVGIPRLLPYEMDEFSTPCTFPVEGYQTENVFTVATPGEEQELTVRVNVPALGDIELPESITVLVPATFRAVNLADPDGGIVACYWNFGDASYPYEPEYPQYQASGVEVIHTYEHSGILTVTLIIADSNRCLTHRQMVVTVTETRPDLLITSITTEPAELTLPWEPSPVRFTVTVRNIGSSPTECPFLVGLYLDGAYLGSLSCPDVLEVGASYTLAPFEIILGSLNRTLSAVADDTELIDEANEANNTKRHMLAVGYPDLVITEVTCDLPGGYKAISWGETVRVTATVSNISSDTQRSFYVVFYLDGLEVASRRVDGLLSGEVKQVTVDIAPAAGNHRIEVRADAEIDRVVEENEENNTFVLLVPGITLVYPDLTVVELAVRPSSGTVPWGSPLDLSALITNAGSGDALACFAVFFFLDGAFAGSGRVSGLASGVSSLVTVSVPATAGSHTVLALIDREGSQPESDEGNNEAGASFGPLSLSMSDLAISGITITPESASAGDPVLALVTVTNTGDAPTLAGFDLLVTLDGVQVALVICQSLEPGSSRTVEAWFTAAAGEGTHTVGVRADSLSLITEEDETNNTATASLTLAGTWEPPSPGGTTITVQSDKTAYAYGDRVTLAGSVTGPSGALSGLLVVIRFKSGDGGCELYAVTNEEGGYKASIPVLSLLEGGLPIPLEASTVTVDAQILEGGALQRAPGRRTDGLHDKCTRSRNADNHPQSG